VNIRQGPRRIPAILAIFLLVQTATYLDWSAEARGRLLVLKSLGGTEGGPPAYSYIVLDDTALGQLSGREYRGIQYLLQARGTKRVDYWYNLPRENLEGFEQGGREYVQYRDASQNGWDIDFRGPFFFHASFWNRTGPEGFYGSSGLFVWILGGWIQVFSGETKMA
jgi:hypothetical protein